MGRLTDTWFNPNKECWELQRTGGVELTFRNTVISTPTWLSLWRKTTKSAYYSVTSFSHWHSEYRTTWIMGGRQWQRGDIEVKQSEVPVMIPVMNAWTFVSVFCSWSVGSERGLFLLYDLPEVEHGMKPEVYHFNGCEKDGYHGRIHPCHQQAGGESLTGERGRKLKTSVDNKI